MFSLMTMAAAADGVYGPAAAAADGAERPTQWAGLTWCPLTPTMGTVPACVEGTAEQVLLRKRYCEALVDKPAICPNQWFAYLEGTQGSVNRSFPQCQQVATPNGPGCNGVGPWDGMPPNG